MDKFDIFLQKLGFSETEVSEKSTNIFTYLVEINETKYEKISFAFTPTNKDIYDKHQLFWNQNDVNSFIAISEEQTFLINAKAKPNIENPIGSNILISTFDYGVNSEGFEKEKIEKISKEYIDSTYFFDFVSKELSKKKKQEVDKDLLLNLICLRNDLLESSNDADAIHLLILRCLFIKYLEDKGIYEKDYLINVLNTSETSALVSAFEEIKRINGDIFKFDKTDLEQKINKGFLAKLHLFFTTDYGSSRLLLFPYQFDQIPIQLISHVYEAFLNSDEKKGKGIYYTPAFFVNFILSHTLIPKLQAHQNITVLDPSVGSGSFLIESFRAIVKSHKYEIDFSKKKEILQNQLFGIDIDRNALQIAAFSLYLALIETEDPLFIREQIKNSSPILPSLIGYNLFHKNSLTDAVFEDKTFDCIVSNPPWGSADPNDDVENVKERKAIGTKTTGKTKGRTGLIPEYKNVADYERSQAFLIRVKKWCNPQTIVSLIVKNSIFLNGDSEDFRKELLELYQINYFYELSDYNKILFEKRVIGKINGKPVEIGATEPCAVLVFELPKINNYTIKYIAPKLNEFAENFQLIHFTQKDINLVEKSRFEQDDLIWRVLVNGDFESYKLIKALLSNKNNYDILASKGFEDWTGGEYGEPIYRTHIKSEDFNQYAINNYRKFNWNQKRRRDGNEELFIGERILVAIRPTQKDNYRLRCVLLNQDVVYFSDIIGFKVKNESSHNPFLGILNSSTIGYLLFNISTQWQGGLKRDSLRVKDIKNLPFPNIINNQYLISEINNRILKLSNGHSHISDYKKEIDEIVFNLFSLKEYEKEIIREFYQIKVERASKEQKKVRKSDIEKYAQKFVEVFSLMLEKGNKLSATHFKISPNIGTAICFTVVEDTTQTQLQEDKTLEILNFVKNNQIEKADFSKILNEDKIKIYDNKLMYIVKSNLFKDWTIRQAIKDAREEINLIISNLPETNG
jgi:N-6 DNA Methylase